MENWNVLKSHKGHEILEHSDLMRSKGLQIARILHDLFKLLRHQLEPESTRSEPQAPLRSVVQ